MFFYLNFFLLPGSGSTFSEITLFCSVSDPIIIWTTYEGGGFSLELSLGSKP